MSVHRFDPEIAKIVGVNAATIYENLCHWTKKNKANGRHFYDDQTWTYNSVSAFADLFPYLSPDQIRGALKKLLSSGLIGKGNYNKVGYDRTLWYSVKSQIDLVEIPNGNGENPEPIPDNKPDNKPDIPLTRVRKPFIDAVRNRWEAVAIAHGYPSAMMMNAGRVRLIEKRLGECGGDEAIVLMAIDNMPNNTHWTGKSGDMSHITFEWVFGPPKPDKPDRFVEAVESKKPTPKAQHDRSNTNHSRQQQKSNSLIAAAIGASEGMGDYSDFETYSGGQGSPARRIEGS